MLHSRTERQKEREVSFATRVLGSNPALGSVEAITAEQLCDGRTGEGGVGGVTLYDLCRLTAATTL